MPSSARASVTVQAPATVGNFGPGFDVTSLALADLGDALTLEVAPEDQITLAGPGSQELPTAWHENLVGPTLDALRTQAGIEDGLHVHIEKPRPAGSGLGSSASSAGGAALALHALFPEAGFTKADLVAAAGRAEGKGQAAHYDDVGAVIQGGLSLVEPGPEGLTLARIAPPGDLVLGVVVPAFALPTHRMREVLPEAVPRQDAVANLARLARLVDACHRGDVPAMGRAFVDAIATPHRKRLIPFYDDARHAALEAGAHGAGLSGSGPSMVALCQDEGTAKRCAGAMARACQAHDVHAEALVAHPEHEVPYDVVTMR